MEPVPETERMEEFRSSPLPSLRLQSSPGSYSDSEQLRKPPTLRRSTDPSPSSPTSSAWGVSSALPYRPRTTSPLSGHARSRSAASIGHPMSRTQSLPGVNGAGHILYPPQLRPPSPLGSAPRVRPSRKHVDEAFPTSPVRSSVFESERPGLPGMERSSSPTLAVSTPTSTINRYRRPSSPLRHVAGSPSPSIPPPSSFSAGSSPSIRPYDGLSSSYGMALALPSSSVPSTPTSARSRSPSISSLETIPDSPDAEEAAMEAERIAQLKAAADMADGSDSAEVKGRGSLDVPARGRTMNFGSRDKRKRWSVCGAERRGDLDLETIWED